MKRRILTAVLALVMLLTGGCAAVLTGGERIEQETPAQTAPAEQAEKTTAPTESQKVAKHEVHHKTAREMMEDMTLEEKIYQLFFVTPESITGVKTAVQAGKATQKALEDQPVGGIIYFAKNLKDPA